MRSRLTWIVTLAALGLSGLWVWSGSRAQDRSSPPATKPTTSPNDPPKPVRDLSKLAPLERQMELSAQRGADWLFRANRADGRFVYGYVPALQKVLEGDHYLR